MRFMKSSVLDIIKWDGTSEHLSKLNDSIAYFNDSKTKSEVLNNDSYIISSNGNKLVVPIGESLVVFNNGSLATTNMLCTDYERITV